jgi:hypothetical protein
MLQPDLPKVVEFGHVYDVRVETHDGFTRVTARIKPGKQPTHYRKYHELPFCRFDQAAGRYRWWWFEKADNYAEQHERGQYFWNEYVAYVRGPQKRRRAEAVGFTKSLLNEIHNYRDGATEAGVFLEKLAEALVGHLRADLDVIKSDAEVVADGVAEVPA